MSSSNTFPVQKISLRDKTEEWKKSCVDAIIAKGSDGFFMDGQSRKDRMKIAYELYNSNFDEKDFKHVTDPYNIGDSFPSKMQNHNIVRPKIDLLLGEESKRAFTFKVIQTNDEAVSGMQTEYKQMVLQYLISTLNSDKPEDDNYLADLQKYMKYSYKNIAEETAYNALNYLKEKLNIQNEFIKGWKDALVAGEELYYVGILNGEPTFERVNPIYSDYDRSPDIEFIDQSTWFKRLMHLSPSTIYDRYYSKLEESDLDEILEMTKDGHGGVQMSGQGGIKWNTTLNTGMLNNEEVEDTLEVQHVVWSSYKKIGFLIYVDEQGIEQIDIVDESYDKDPEEKIEWEWITEVWEGYRIGSDMYFGMQPIEFQHQSLEALYENKIPFTGAVYSNTNSRGKSLLEIMKPLQYMYLVLWYRLDIALARDKGKALVMDITQIPKSMGVTTEKFLHYLSALGVVFFNPYEEGWDIPGREGGKCFGRNTLILMYDGTIKTVQNIKIGDIIMGPKHTPRTVIECHTGIDNMYKIVPSSGGETQIVNSKHEVFYGLKNHHTNEISFKTSTPEELMLKFKKTPSCRDKYFLYRDKGIDFKEQDLILDPYMLGLWLGDGSTGKSEITNMDYEVISYLNDFAITHDMEIMIKPSNNKAFRIVLTAGEKENFGYRNVQKNWLINRLRDLNIFFNKDIPEEYIYNSRENRLKLLAGLIDTDGWYDKKKNRFGFVQKRKHITDKVAFIARSLGMKVSTRIKNGYYELTILSNLMEIPTKIERKKALREKFFSRDTNRSMFNIEYYDVSEYYGFTLKEDPLFLLSDFTICHNSSSFNQFSSVDLSMSNVIAGYVQLMAKIEDMIGEISGVSRQRQGQIQKDELVGNVQQTIIQSSHITEPLFGKHNQVKRRCLNMLIDTAKYAWGNSKKKTLHFILPDMSRVFSEVTKDFLNADLDVFVIDSTKETQDIERLKTLLPYAVQNGATLLEAAEVATGDNVLRMKKQLEEIDIRKTKQQEELAKREQETQMQIQQMLAQDKAEANRIKEEDSIRKAETALNIALINADAKDGEMLAGNEDTDDNGIRDQIDLMKVQLQKDKQRIDAQQKDRQLAEEVRRNRVAEQQKEKEIAIKRKVASRPISKPTSK